MKFLILLLVLISCTKQATQYLHGVLPNGKKVEIFELKNANGIKVLLSEYGASIVTVETPDKTDKVINIAYGYKSFYQWINSNRQYGSTIGRFANRISKGKVLLNNKTYQLTLNESQNHLHGGVNGFDKKVWSGKIIDNKISFSHKSVDGDEGYPGNLDVEVTYHLTDKNELIINYKATTDKITVINLTNHTYWKLAHSKSDHMLSINADYYLPSDKNLIPTGEYRSINDTIMDFRKPRSIEHHYDHSWKINGRGLRLAADLSHKKSEKGIRIYTDQPGIHLYTTKNAIALEAQNFADAPNQENFPSSQLNPGEIYQRKIILEFYLKNSTKRID